jgi:hypothetical protein
LLKNGGKLLKSKVIIELDLSACFNNIDKRNLLESLRDKYGLPSVLIKIIYHFITMPIKKRSLKDLPSKDGLIERIINKDFDDHNRGLIQGLPISPILAILAIKNGFENLQRELKLSRSFKMLCYADDISFYMNQEDYQKIGGKEFVKKLNNCKSLIEAGLVIDPAKSEIVKEGDTIRKNLKLLGLSYNFQSGIIKSETRGRMENTVKRIKRKDPISMELKFDVVKEMDIQMENYINQILFLKSISSLDVTNLFKHKTLKKYFNTLLSYIF